MSGVRIEIVGVGAYVKGEGDKRARPYRRGAVLTVDEQAAGRLIASGVAVREGEKPAEPGPVEPVTVEDDDSPVDFGSLTVPELEAMAEERGLEVEGSGADGNVLKADLVAALEASDS